MSIVPAAKSASTAMLNVFEILKLLKLTDWSILFARSSVPFLTLKLAALKKVPFSVSFRVPFSKFTSPVKPDMSLFITIVPFCESGFIFNTLELSEVILSLNIILFSDEALRLRVEFMLWIALDSPFAVLFWKIVSVFSAMMLRMALLLRIAPAEVELKPEISFTSFIVRVWEGFMIIPGLELPFIELLLP